jgi:hypothetical protein
MATPPFWDFTRLIIALCWHFVKGFLAGRRAGTGTHPAKNHIMATPPTAREGEGDEPQPHGERRSSPSEGKHHENAGHPPATKENRKKEENENGGKGDNGQ